MDRNLSQHEQQFINKTATSEVSFFYHTLSVYRYKIYLPNIIYTNAKSLHIECIKIPLAETIKFISKLSRQASDFLPAQYMPLILFM